MPTIANIITRVEKRLALAAGIDVQTHGEDKFLEMIRHKYNILFDDHWWYDFLTLEQFTLTGVNGLISNDVSTKIKRFIDIQSVYINGNARPTPLLPVGTNPDLFMAEAISPYPADATKMFKVWPLDRTGHVNVWYRTRLDDDDWDIEKAETTNINLDDELLILGTVYDWLVDDASNEDAARKYQQQYEARYQQLVTLGMQHGISKYDASNGIPTQWSLNG